MIEVGGIYLPDGDRHFADLGDEICAYQERARDYALQFVRNWTCAVDAGAHVGLFSRAFASRFGEVHAFEPIPEHVECLARNVPANVTVHPYALGDAPEVRQAVRTGKNSGGAFICDDAGAHPPEQLRAVEVRPLDALNLPSVGLMKIDVQGFELDVLRGARATLARCRPVVLLEERPAAGEGGDTAHIEAGKAILAALGYTSPGRIHHDRVYIPY